MTAYMRKARDRPPRRWRSVFVVLTTDAVSWFKKEETSAFFGTLRGTVTLADVVSVDTVADPEARNFEIKSVDGRRRRFQAKSAEACAAWVAAVGGLLQAGPPALAAAGAEAAAAAAAAAAGGGGAGLLPRARSRQGGLEGLDFRAPPPPPAAPGLTAVSVAPAAAAGGTGGGAAERVTWLGRCVALPLLGGGAPAAAAAAGGVGVGVEVEVEVELRDPGETVRCVLGSGATATATAEEVLEACCGAAPGVVFLGHNLAVEARARAADPAGAAALLRRRRRPAAAAAAGGEGAAAAAACRGSIKRFLNRTFLGTKALLGLDDNSHAHILYALSVLYVVTSVRLFLFQQQISSETMVLCCTGCILAARTFVDAFRGDRLSPPSAATGAVGAGARGPPAAAAAAATIVRLLPLGYRPGGGGRRGRAASRLAAAAAADALPPPPGTIPPPPQKFIDGCSWAPDPLEEAKRRWATTYHWRLQNDIDGLLTRPQPWYHLIKKCYPHFYSGRSRDGELVYYEKTGYIDLSPAEAAGATLDDLVSHYLFLVEYCWRVLDTSPQGKCVNVIDLKNVKLSFCRGKALEFLKRTSAILQDNYPESCRVLLIVNVPSWFSLIWKIVKVFVNEITLRKIRIANHSDTLKVLNEFIDIDQIPAIYGGTALYGDGGPDDARHSSPLEQQTAAYVDALPAVASGQAPPPPPRWCPCHGHPPPPPPAPAESAAPAPEPPGGRGDGAWGGGAEGGGGKQRGGGGVVGKGEGGAGGFGPGPAAACRVFEQEGEVAALVLQTGSGTSDGCCGVQQEKNG